jgi:S-adenosylmethionine:tRNA ribosyltransferase-isomerase
MGIQDVITRSEHINMSGMDSTSRSRSSNLAGMTGYSGDTNLYITPGYEFQLVDALVTNFHAPRTSLLVLVAAFMGLENMQAAYQYALDHMTSDFSVLGMLCGWRS